MTPLKLLCAFDGGVSQCHHEPAAAITQCRKGDSGPGGAEPPKIRATNEDERKGQDIHWYPLLRRPCLQRRLQLLKLLLTQIPEQKVGLLYLGLILIDEAAVHQLERKVFQFEA